jgi:hypothetical protein
MRRMYEFVCENGHLTESLVAYEVTDLPCWCGGKSRRIISAAAISLEGWSGHFPSAHGRFDRIHREKLKAERKANA